MAEREFYSSKILYPTIVALNMVDVAEKQGHRIDAAQLGAALGVPVLPLVASTGEGVADLKKKMESGGSEEESSESK